MLRWTRVVPAALALATGCGGAAGTSVSKDGGGTDQVVGPHVLTTLDLGAPMNASLVGFWGGSGPWSVLSGSGGRYAFDPSGTSYGLAVACNTSGPQVFFYATTTDQPNPVIDCDVPQRLPTVSGTIGGVPSLCLGTPWVAVGESSVPGTYDSTGTQVVYSLAAPDGTYDLLGIAYLGSTPRLLVQRGLAVSGGTTANVDFSTQGMPLVAGTSSLTVAGLMPGETGSTELDYRTTRTVALHPGLLAIPEQGLALGSNAATYPTYPHVPAALAASGDLYVAVGAGVTPGGTPPVLSSGRLTFRFFATPADVGLPLPPAYAPTLVASMMPPPSAQVTFPSYAGAVGYEAVCGPLRLYVSPGARAVTPTFTLPDPAVYQSPGLGAFMVPGVAGPCVVSALSGDDPGGVPHDGTVRSIAAVEFQAGP